MRPLSLALVLAFPSAAALGQALRLEDVPAFLGAATFDPTRGTVVHLATGGLRELVGGSWRTLPTNAPFDPYSMTLLASPRQRQLFAVRTLGSSYGNDPETWRFDGVTWTRLAIPLPPPRMSSHITWDLVRDEAVLFGGFDPQAGFRNDTWTFDGATWTQRQPATSPPGFGGGAITFDLVRQRAILVDGGMIGDLQTFAWDGTNWSVIASATRPPARVNTALAYDVGRDRVVLAGGSDVNGTLADGWEFDGLDWRAVAALPFGGRQLHQLVHDLVGRRTLLMGGYDGMQMASRDVWSWNGTAWSSGPAFAGAPVPVEGAAMAVEPGGASVLLVGGGVGHEFPQYVDQTWRWDGASWTQLPGSSPACEGALAWSQNGQLFLLWGHQFIRGVQGRRTLVFVHDHSVWGGSGWQALPPGAAPSARMGAALAVDTLRNRAVVFGGVSQTVLYDETWTFDGTSWQLTSPAVRPAGRFGHAMAYDAARDRVVLRGGSVSGASAWPTWEWNGTNWAAVSTARQPDEGSLVFDAQSQRVLSFVNDPVASPTGTALWSYDGVDWSPQPLDLGSGQAFGHAFAFQGGVVVAAQTRMQRYRPQPARIEGFGAACAADAPQLSAAMWPDLGQQAFGLELRGAAANAPALLAGSTAAIAQPLLGCTLLVDPTQALVFVLTSPGGAANVPLPVPAQPGLVGVQLHFQAAALSPLAPQGIALSRGLRLVVGR